MVLLTTTQLADYLGLKPSTVQTYAKKKQWDKIPPPIKVGNRNRWDRDGIVDKWLIDRQVGSGTKPKRNASV